MAPPFDYPTLTTDRLRLIVPGPEHAPWLRDFIEENREHLQPWGPPMPDKLFTEAFWEGSVERARAELREGRGARFVMTRPGRPGITGRVNLVGVRGAPWQSCTLGYELARSQQGQGLMHEALRALLRYGFVEMGLHRIDATYRAHNARSGRVLARLGFVVEGRARGYVFADGVWHDSIMTGLLAEEFSAQ